ncbi:MAG TPA: hypothetical protein VFK19_00400 [Sphingomicrobium sp.]|nr:hypothetical protein [Sphingomicrobium sp.]
MTSTARTAPHIRRQKLLISCASIALIAVALANAKARAQVVGNGSGAFQGNPSLVSGGVGINRGDTTDTITVRTPTATIDWSPYDNEGSGPIDFLPAENVATFTSTEGLTDYTVLNRIVPSDPSRSILLNGTVLSTLQGSSQTGGNIWFYSPGGIVVGATAVFDVGGLLLTSIDLPNGFTADSNGFSATFAPTEETGSGAIQILKGAQINARDSYVALIAPRIEQGGAVRVDGSAAYVAGDQVTMTFNQGLFDIAVDVGTDDPNGIVHTGTTGGSSNVAAADNHTIYMAAVPKNQAMTMLLGGNVGYDDAVTAGVENGKIVLSAGIGAFNGSLAGISIDGGSFTSSVDATADTDILALADSGNLSFSGDVSLTGARVHLGALNGNQLTVGGNATLGAWTSDGSGGEALIDASGTGSKVDIDGDAKLDVTGYGNGGATGFGGTATIQADGGAVTVGGLTSLIADAGSGRPVEGNSGDAFGGSANIQATDGGTVTLADTNLSAIGTGDDNFGNGDGIAGDGNGGDVNIFADTAGSITVNGNLTANAGGAGGNMLDGSTAGGQGIGGNIHMSVVDGSIGVTGMTTMTARGEGGGWIGEGSPSTAQGGLGQGGFIDIFGNGPGSISLNGIGLDSTGTGGDGQTGGDGRAGNAGVRAVDGTIALGPNIGINANGIGGNATVGFGGFGGFGQGGTAYIEALADPGNIEVPATHGTITGGSANLDVSGFGGTGGAGNGDNILPGSGGNGQGGFHQGEEGTGGAFAAAAEPGGSLTLGDTTLVSNGQGGAGGAGGPGQAGGFGGDGSGGSTQAGNYDPDETGGTTATATYGNLTMFADGTGGFGGFGGENAPQGDGGAGLGGGVFVNAKGIVHAVEMSLSAIGSGGSGTNGGFGQGGTGILQSWTGSQLNVDNDVTMDVSAFGGEGSGGLGGNAAGGNSGEGAASGGISAQADASIDIGGTATIRTDARGGNGFTGGEGSGGQAYMETLGGSISTNAIVLSAQGHGGDGVDAGGAAFGGAATMFIDGGSIEATGTTDIFRDDELEMTGSIVMLADAFGGTGLTGGEGSGGDSSIILSENGGSLSAAGATFLLARGIGGAGDDNDEGDGGTGGEGDGGSVSITTNPLVADASALVSLADAKLDSSGTGGAGGASASAGNGGAGGTAGAGRADIDIAAGTKLTAGDIRVFASGFGGDGGSSAEGTGGAGGLADGGSIGVDIGGELNADSVVGLSKGFGGFGGSGLTAGVGGDATGGQNQVNIFFGGVANIGTGFVFSSSPIGGDGSDGGSASGGISHIQVDGSLTAGGLVESAAQAFGGTGLSGTGGNATAGTASIDVTGSLTAGQLFVGAGAGGLNESDQIYGSGQVNGGSAFAGSASLTASGGTIDIGAEGALVTAEAVGGNGTTGVGGFASAGDSTVESTSGGSISGGTAGGKLTMNANATGGDGSTAGGADAGDVTLHADASDSGLATSIDMATVDLTARGVLGAGATDSESVGRGGTIDVEAYDASIAAGVLSADAFGSLEGGTIQLESESGSPGAQPGRLQFDTLDAFADSDGTGGSVTVGAGSGTTSDIGEAKLGASGELDGGGSVQIFAGDPETGAGTLLADSLTATANNIGFSTYFGGNVTVAGTLQADATDIVTFFDDGNAGLVSADIFNVNAFGITFDGTSLGTNIDGTTSVDFETIGNLDVGDGFVTGSLTLHSDAALTTGNLSSGGNMAMSGASIGAGTLDSGGNMTLDSGAALTALDLTATGRIDLDSIGDMQFGDVDADTLDLSSGGGVIGGNIVADTRAGGDAQGAMRLGDITVGPNIPEGSDFSIGFSSATSIQVGDVSGADKVGFATPGTFTAGNISAGSLFIALVSGDIHVGSLTTNSDGQVYMADSSMFTDAGGPDDFDPAPVLASDPVATAGSITVDGPVSTGTFRAAAGSDFSSAGILATGNVTASAGGILSVESADIGGDLSLSAGDNIDSGDLSADGSLTLSAATDLGTGKLSAGASLSLTTGGNLSAGPIDSAEDLLLTAGGTLTTLDLTAVGTIELNSTGDMQFGNVDADSLHLSGGAAVNGGNIIADTRASGDAEGAIKLGDINVGPNIPENGDFSVSFSSGTSIQVGNVSGADKVGFATPGTFTAGNISGGSLILALVTGDIHVGSLTTNSDGQVYMADYSMFTDAGGPDDFDPVPVLASDPVATGGSITIDDLVSTGAFRAAAGTDFGSATIQAGDGVSISAGGNLSVGDSSAGGDLTLTAGGEISAGDVGTDGLLSLSAGTDLNAGNLSSGGNLELDAGGNITTLDLTSQEAVAASATGDLKVGKVISGFTPGIAEDAVEATGQDVRLEAENGNLTTDAIQSAGGIFLDAGQNVVATDLTAVDAVQVTAGGDSSVNNVNASGATFDAGGTASFFGTVAVPTIGVTSSDINIADGASLGVSGLTTLITLGAVSDNPVILGGPEGASAPGQYILSEAGDINADSVVLTATGKSEGVDPDVIIQDAQIEGSQTEGGGVGSVEVDTGGAIRVEGFLDYINAAASDALTFNAGSGIQVITGTGGISITDGAGNLSGTLNLIAPDVWVADQSVIDKLAEDPNYANRDSDLATNSGEDNQDGNLRAGAILGEVSGSFLVQNSGTADNPAGISVGEGGLTIVNSGESPVLAIVNGHQVGPGGQIVGGNDFLPTVGFDGDAGFAAASTVNGCSIISGCALPPPPPPPPPAPTFQFGAESILGPIGLMTNAENEGDQGDSGDGTEGDNNGNDELDILLFGLNSGPNAFDPLVDDPVTSGNDSITSGGPQ